jgi:hypothetical protein
MIQTGQTPRCSLLREERTTTATLHGDIRTVNEFLFATHEFHFAVSLREIMRHASSIAPSLLLRAGPL